MKTTTRPQYNRHLLHPDELYLLEVDRSNAEEEGRLTFHLEWFTRTSAPRYTAISYTWGDEPPERQISIDSGETYISLNLWWCLFNIRHHTDWKYVWVDALCIDQGDDHQKSGQVREMATTYHDAELVAAWLGDENEANSESQQCALGGASASVENVDVDNGVWSWERQILQLAGRRYWTRRWIAQELFHARRIEILCGRHRLPWKDFQSLLLRHHADEGEQQLQGPLTIQALLQDHNRKISPLETLVNLRHLHCTDIRDRIFALISLFPAQGRKQLEPDYSLTHEEVVGEFMQGLIKSGENYDAITRYLPDLEESFGFPHCSGLLWSLCDSRLDPQFGVFVGYAYAIQFICRFGMKEWYRTPMSEHQKMAQKLVNDGGEQIVLPDLHQSFITRRGQNESTDNWIRRLNNVKIRLPRIDFDKLDIGQSSEAERAQRPRQT